MGAGKAGLAIVCVRAALGLPQQAPPTHPASKENNCDSHRGGNANSRREKGNNAGAGQATKGDGQVRKQAQEGGKKRQREQMQTERNALKGGEGTSKTNTNALKGGEAESNDALKEEEKGASKNGQTVAGGLEVVLVDRQTFRQAADKAMRDEIKVPVRRVRIDLADLQLAQLAEVQGKQVVVIAKHLCGNATDMTLRCVRNAARASRDATAGAALPCIAGAAIATCCHHRCNWDDYVGKDYLLSRGFSAATFPLLCRISCWAVTFSKAQEKPHHAELKAIAQQPLSTELSEKDKLVLGLQAKLLLDEGRRVYLSGQGGSAGSAESAAPLFSSRLLRYVSSALSPENLLLLASFL